MTTDTSSSELLSLRARCASLESRLKEEVAAHAGTKAILEDRAGQGDDEDKLRLILEHMPVMMNAFDENGVCVAWNAECERVLGFSAEEMIGNPSVLDLLVPDPAYRTSMAAEWAGKGDHRDWEWEHTTKDGRELTIAWSNISESFPVQGWATWGIGVDLTERTRALELLQTARRELEDRVAERTVELQGVLDNIADGVVAISESGTIESFNPAAEKIFGYTAREATGKTVGILLPDSEHSQRNGDVTTYVDTGNGGILGAGSREVTARRKDGSSFPMELSVGELELGDRRVFVCAMRDISERKRADAEIRESQEMLSGFMASATDNFMILDHDLNILDLNENAARRRGQSRDNLIGRNLADVVRDSVSFGRFEAFKKVLITGRPHHFEAGVVRSGQDVQLAGTAFRIGTNRVGVTTHDVTDRVLAERAIRNKEAEVRRHQEMLAGFMDAAGEGFAILDQDLLFVDINREGTENLGIPKSEVVGRTYLEVLEISGRTNLAGLEACTEVFRTGKRVKFEGSAAQKPTGRIQWITGQAFPIGKDRAGLIISNTTERAEAERALRESEARYRDMVESVSDRVWELDADLRVTSCKGRGAHWAEKWIGKHPWDLNEGIPEWRQLMATLKAHMSYRDFPLTVHLDDGTIRHSRSSGRPVFDEEGKFAGYRGVTVDETEQREAELRAQEAETLLQEAIGAMPDGFIIFDADQKFVRCNDTYREMYIEIADLLAPGTPRADLSAAFTRSSGANTFSERRTEALAGSGADFFGEHHEHQRSDGRWIRSVDRRLPDGSVVGIRTDITDLKRREEETRKSEEILSGFMESATESFAIFDRDLNYIDVNGMAARSMGLQKDEIIGRNICDLRPETKSSGRWDTYKEVLQTGKPHRFDISLPRRSTGKLAHLSGTAFRIGDDLLGMTAHDITDRQRALDDLKESEQRLLESQRIARTGTFEHNLVNGEIVWTDEAFRLLGYAPGEVKPSFANYVERVHPDDLAIVRQAQTEIQKGERPADSMRRVVWPDGSVHMLNSVVSMERDEGGEPFRLTSTMQDITDRVEAEDKLRDSSDALAEAQRIAHIGSWGWDLDTDETFWSDEHWAICGLIPREVSRIDPGFFDSLVHPDDLEKLRTARQHSLETGSPFVADLRIVRPNGEVRYVHSRGEQIDTEHGRHAMGTLQDVTDRVQAEEELRSSQSMFERAFESSPGLAYIVSFPNNRLLKVNDAWCRRLGYKREEVIGRTTDEIAFWIDDEARKLAARAEFSQTGAIQFFPTMFRAAQGETIHVEVSADGLEFEGGEAVFKVAHDRTERKAFEDAIWEAKENAELANRTKSEFLANVSHELRTPLNAILGFSEMMSSGLAGPLTEKQSDYLSDIFASGELLLGLIGDVIDLSTIELGKLKLVIGKVDLHECVEDCVTQLKNRIAELGLRLRVGDLSALPYVSGDKRRIKQVIINLLSNAAKFTDPDGKISIEGVVTGQHECAIAITDTGVGMSKAMVRQALTAFKRGEDPMLRNMEGVGLGLSLVQSMVEIPRRERGDRECLRPGNLRDGDIPH